MLRSRAVKAAVYYRNGPPDVLRYEDVPEPDCPPNFVRIENAAISIEGGDTLNRLRGALAGAPHVVGYQSAGTIVEVGREVRDRAVGQRVVGIHLHGSHAERRVCPAGSTWLLPEGLDFERAACVPIPFGTADDCLFEFGRLRAGETVLVHAAAGGLGMATVQLAKRAGATVLATASSAERLARLAPLGVDHGIDYLREDFVAVARERTGGRGPDLVVDSVGGRTLEQSIACAAYRGRIITVGDAGRGAAPPDVSGLRPANKSLTGVFLGAELFFSPGRVHPMIARHLESVAKGDLDVVVDRVYPLAEAAAAHAYIESRQAFGRVLLRP
jgi:NADPH2:quinone reductase